MLDENVVIARKVDIVQNQLFAAIHLFFFRDDPIATHTLAEASYQILNDIGKANDKNFEMFKDQLMNSVKPEKRKEFRDNYLNHARNFFKHADDKKENTLEAKCTLVILSSHMVLYSACFTYCKMIGVEITKVPAMYIFTSWCMLKYPEILLPASFQTLAEEHAKDLRGMDKREFFKYSYEVLKRLGFAKGTIHDFH